MDAGHAPTGPGTTAQAAMAHYDNSALTIADIVTGEDAFGVWFAGAMHPDVTDAQVRRLRANALSGDWRKLGGGLELIAALAVPVQGFPVQRAMVASGEVTALIAAGVTPALKHERVQLGELVDLRARVERMELRDRVRKLR